MEDFLVRNGLVPYFVGFIFALISIGMFVSSITHAQLVKRLKSEGILTLGTVTDMTKTYIKNPDMMDNKHILIVYTVQNRRYTLETYVYPRSDKIYGGIELGDSISILYSPLRPSDVILSEETVQTSNWSYLLLFLSGSVFFAAIFRTLNYSSTLASQ